MVRNVEPYFRNRDVVQGGRDYKHAISLLDLLCVMMLYQFGNCNALQDIAFTSIFNRVLITLCRLDT